MWIRLVNALLDRWLQSQSKEFINFDHIIKNCLPFKLIHWVPIWLPILPPEQILFFSFWLGSLNSFALALDQLIQRRVARCFISMFFLLWTGCNQESTHTYNLYTHTHTLVNLHHLFGHLFNGLLLYCQLNLSETRNKHIGRFFRNRDRGYEWYVCVLCKWIQLFCQSVHSYLTTSFRTVDESL